MKSRSLGQLKGQELTKADVQVDCDPAITNEDMEALKSFNGQPLKMDDVAIPCGLIAKTVFTDRFSLHSLD